MFSLIITIISIALVAALALATLYYGGDAFNQGRAGAEASTLINEGQQVNAAVALARATNVTPLVDLEDLTPAVLAQLPQTLSGAGATPIADGIVVVANVANDVCEEVQTRAGSTALALVDQTAAEGAAQIYGCFGAADSQSFFFKF